MRQRFVHGLLLAIALTAVLAIPADAQVGPQWVCSGSPCSVSRINVTSGCSCSGGTITLSGGGTGTLTSISASTGITLTPNPITTTGTVGLTVPVAAPNGGTDQTVYTIGDMLYASATNALSKLAKGNAGEHLRYNSTIPAVSEAYTISGSLDSGTTGAGNVDLTVFSVPAGATSNTNSFLLNGVVVRVTVAMTGGGSITLNCGTSAGGQDYLLSQTVNSSTGVGTTYGLTTAQVGTAFTSANMYNALINGSTSVICRSAMTGTVSTHAVFIITVSGEAL